MSGARPISEATRQRINQAIEELGYHPNRLARSLAGRRTKIIALLYPTQTSGYLDDIQLEFISSVANTASCNGYGMLLFTTRSGEQDILRFIRERLIDGLILMEVEMQDARVSLMKQMEYPFSLIGHCENNDGVSFVDLDFYNALRMCVEHLAELGHREIAFLSTTQNTEAGTATYVHESMRSFNETVTQLGIHGVIRVSHPSIDCASEAMRALFEEHPGITAAIAANDPIYSGMVDTIQARGLTIPGDFSTVGIISQQTAERYNPKVTSLTIPSGEMGRLGAEFLIQRLEGKLDEPRQVLLSPKLIIRQSTSRSPMAGG